MNEQMPCLEHNVSNPSYSNQLQPNITRAYKPIPEFSGRLLRSFWKRVDRRGPSECWLWLGGTTTGINGGTYGVWRGFRPHRVVYTLLVGPIPEGHTLDHLRESGVCTSTLCCNPAHTEPVTQSVNTKRYRASLPRICKRGHRMPETGNCGQCIRIMSQAYYENHKAEILEYHKQRRRNRKERAA